MVMSMKGSGLMIRFMVRVHILGIIQKLILGNGNIIIRMEKAHLLGMMAENT